ncbi:hypothetical protein BYT27DRAFT_7184222 [Phlegmacium glaucopus]|nr:hypothetical protein BYT27DRAFT_7184222 [Phlegmacium glaucopus]
MQEALFPSIGAVYKQTGSGSTEACPGHVQLTCLPILLSSSSEDVGTGFLTHKYNVYSKRSWTIGARKGKEVIIPGSQVVMLDC